MSGRGRSTVATKRLRLLLLHGNSSAASLLLQVSPAHLGVATALLLLVGEVLMVLVVLFLAAVC